MRTSCTSSPSLTSGVCRSCRSLVKRAGQVCRSGARLRVSLVKKLVRHARTSGTSAERIHGMGKYSSLRDIAQAASKRHDGAHGRRLGRVAEKAGLVLSYTTVDKILAGTYMSRPDTKTLDALSTLSGVPRAEVYRAAGEPLPLAPLAEVLPQDADLLTAVSYTHLTLPTKRI